MNAESRTQLRRQWKQHCAEHGYIPWKQWGIDFVPLAEADSELARDVAALKGSDS